jgi:hypothetical protein
MLEQHFGKRAALENRIGETGPSAINNLAQSLRRSRGADIRWSLGFKRKLFCNLGAHAY